MVTLHEISSLPLDSPRWTELQHAYGQASDIPDLLRQLTTLPSSKNQQEPWFSLWSSLAHQNDIYSASFAAVPHVIKVLDTSPLTADFNYFQFPAFVEICRKKSNIEIPSDLKTDYFEALARLPTLVASAAAREWDETFLASAMSAIAASKGFCNIAEVALELTPEVADEFMKRHFLG